MTAHRYCRRSIAASTDSPLRIHSLDSLADSGLRRFGAAPSVPVALSSVPPSGERHSRIHRVVAAVGVSLRSVSFSSHIGCTVNFVGLPWTSRLRNLPLHLIAAIMVWEREKSTFKYLLCGILLLHSMCDLASRVPKIEQILLDDAKMSEEQLIDLVFYLLVLLGAYIHVYICKEAAFAAVCVEVKYLWTNDSSRSVSPTTEETLNHLGCSVILLFNFYSPCVSKSCFGNALLTNRFF
ncbi:hypothetical protein SASPL_114997 [Salvia splendens]|uniref:Nodulin homeobox N-terminal domain-containing protein n=1 Tax=Salvia splendens TaxID=180675 RepID=A0A8X8Y4D0_SALSN|nr:hypothetical protein SASPL_114997 [Salvia splendens]